MARLQDVIGRGPTASRPATPATGGLYFDTDLQHWVRWSGTAWEDAERGLGSTATTAAAGNHTHAYEPALGNPAADGYHLASTAAGVRSWVAPAVGGMTNPMTTLDDLIVGGAAGAAARLAKGADGQVLTVDPTTHHLVWATPAAAGMSNPMTTAGDVIYGGAAGAPARLPKGSDTQVLTLVSGAPAWQTPASGGMTDPTTTKGDLIVHGASTTRLPVGADNTVLTADSSQTLGMRWVAASGGGSTNSSGTYASRPAAGTAGRIYYATDYDLTFMDTGSAWQLIRGNSIDVPPASPNAINDEFISSTLNAKWTATTTGTAPTWDIHTSVPGMLYASFGRADGGLTLTQAWAPSLPYSLTLACRFAAVRTYQSVGVYVSDSGGTNQVRAIFEPVGATSANNVAATGLTAALSTETSGTWTFGAQVLPLVPAGRLYLHLQADVSSNWSIWYSTDGLQWVGSNLSIRAFTAAKMQIQILQGGALLPQRTTVDWVRANILTL